MPRMLLGEREEGKRGAKKEGEEREVGWKGKERRGRKGRPGT